MSFVAEYHALAAAGTGHQAPGLKQHDFFGAGGLLIGGGAGVLSAGRPHQHAVLVAGAAGAAAATHNSPTNSSQSDTATAAQLSLGSSGAAPTDVASRGPSNGAAAAAGAAAVNTASNSKGSARAAHQHHHNHNVAVAAGGYDAKREWLYRLVTFPHYFTPCHSCCGGASTPKREQLMTLFDMRAPHRVFCCHCPTPKGSTGHFSASHGREGALLQVRRSSFKNAVNAVDISRFGADLGGVQQYTLNGNKIIYLAREASAKKTGTGAPPPAQCSVDGRAMMDKNSLYCSLMCKMQAEDPGFTNWLDSQDPSVRIMAQVAANAPPVPTVACKRTYYTTSSSGRDGSSASPRSCDGSNGSGAMGGGVVGGLKDSSGSSGAMSAGLPSVAQLGLTSSLLAASGAGAGGGAQQLMSAFTSAAMQRSFQQQQQGQNTAAGNNNNRPAKVARLTARSNSAPLAFAAAAAAGGGGAGGYSGSEALLMGMTGGRSSSGALLEGLITPRPHVARQLLANGPNAAAVEAAARQAAVAAAAAAFSGAGTSAAAAAARDALGAAGLAPIRTGNGSSPVYSSIATAQQPSLLPQQLQQQQAPAKQQGPPKQPKQPKQAKAQQRKQQGAGAGAGAGGAGQQGQQAAAGRNAGYKQLTAQQPRPKQQQRPESPRAPGLDSADSTSHYASGSRAAAGPAAAAAPVLPEPFLPGTEAAAAPGGVLCVGYEGVGGLLDLGSFDGSVSVNPGAPCWGSAGDIAGLLGVSDSHSPMHMHAGLGGFDAFFGDGSLSPGRQMMF